MAKTFQLPGFSFLYAMKPDQIRKPIDKGRMTKLKISQMRLLPDLDMLINLSIRNYYILPRKAEFSLK